MLDISLMRKFQWILNSQCSSHKDTATEQEKAQFKAEYQKKSRDNARTPMQWNSSPQAGFTTGKRSWMRVNDNYETVNAADQTSDPSSVYHCWRQVLETRKALKDIFVYGDYKLIDEPNEKIFAYTRIAANGEKALVVCNFTTENVDWNMEQGARMVLISSGGKTLQDFKEGTIRLGPCEAFAVAL